MAIFLQLIVNGLAMGLVYVLLASGFNLIIGISRILFVAYGEFYMLGAWLTVYNTFDYIILYAL